MSERVMILEDDLEDTGKTDFNKRPIVHSVVIVRASDRTVLGKYRDSEFVRGSKKGKDGETVEAEKTISGMDAAKAACVVNGWKVSKY